MQALLATLFLIICLLLIVVVLLQRGRGGGLTASLGGLGSSAFGTRTGDVFTWVTIVLMGVFLLLAVVTAVVFRPKTAPVPDPVLTAVSRTGDITRIRVDVKEVTEPKVYYSLDGTDPTDRSGTLHSLELLIRVADGQTLKVRAYAVDRPPSGVSVWPPPRSVAETAPATESAPATAPTTEAAPATETAPTPESAPATAPAGG